jgi:hypothetical protein
MRKTILTIASSALILFPASRFAAAAEQHHRAHHRASSEFRNSNALVAPLYEPTPEWYRYSGGWSAPAGHQGPTLSLNAAMQRSALLESWPL